MNTSTEKAIRILRKRVPAVTYSSADLFSKSFTYHSLWSGDRPGWERGDGKIDAAGSVTLLNRYSSDGSHEINLPGQGSLSVSPDGIVTNSLDPDMKGFVTPDKKIFVFTNTIPIQPGVTSYDLTIGTISGQTFTTSDLAGAWRGYSLSSGSTSQWIHATASIDATGSGDFSDVVADPPETLGPFTFTLSASGEILQPGLSPPYVFHGSMSFGKDLMCIVSTEGPSSFAITLFTK